MMKLHLHLFQPHQADQMFDPSWVHLTEMRPSSARFPVVQVCDSGTSMDRDSSVILSISALVVLSGNMVQQRVYYIHKDPKATLRPWYGQCLGQNRRRRSKTSGQRHVMPSWSSLCQEKR